MQPIKGFHKDGMCDWCGLKPIKYIEVDTEGYPGLHYCPECFKGWYRS